MIPLRAHAWHTCIHFTIDFVAHDTLGLGLNVCGGLGFLGPGCTCCTIWPYFAQCTAQSTYWAPNTYVLVWMRHWTHAQQEAENTAEDDVVPPAPTAPLLKGLLISTTSCMRYLWGWRPEWIFIRLTLITAWDAWMRGLIKWRGSLTLTTLLI